MALKIRLDGLLCHVGDDADKKEMAVLIDESSHKPKIRIDKKFIIGDPDSDFEETLQKGGLITFANTTSNGDLPNGPATTTNDFKTYVPHLKPVLEGDAAKHELDADVKAKKKDHSHALVYVVYPAGDLTAVSPVADMLEFTFSDGRTVSQCVADESVLTSTNTTGVTVTVERRRDGSRLVVDLKPDAVVNITNMGKGKFDVNRNLTRADAMATPGKGGSCFGVQRIKGGPDDPECSNSQWP
jgi:hypothetical protein